MKFLDRLAMVKGDADACWIWPWSRNHKGYGSAHFRGKTTGAHRAAYELLIGPIPDGLVIDHLCRTPACVNPSHMEPVTSRENIMRGECYAAQNARKTHCMHGHELTGENLYVRRDGKRQCIICRREISRRHRSKSSAKETYRKWRMARRSVGA
jgi:hypothetical protein